MSAVAVSDSPSSAGNVEAREPTRSRRLLERGMVTAEYAIGILAAVAFALVLLGIFHDSSIRQALLNYLLSLISQLASYIK